MTNQEFTCFLEHVLQQYEKDGDLVITDIRETSCTNKGDGFMSEVSAAKIVGIRGSGETYSNDVFIKRPPRDKSRSELMDMKYSFRNEALVYNEILPLLPLGRVNMPQCFYGGEDCIILENLKSQGYTLSDKKGLDLAHSELVMQAIGKFHASTYFLKLSNKDKFYKITSKIFNILTNEEIPLPCLESSLIVAINNLKQSHDDSIGASINKLECMKGKVANTIRQFETSKTIVLGHRDLWINNFMFSYHDGAVQDVRIVDFQVILPMSLGPDLWKFLYVSLLPDALNANCDFLISTYCTVFIDTLRTLGLPNNQIPEEQMLKNEIHSSELYGLLTAFWYLPVLYAKQEDNSTVTEHMVSDSNFNKRGHNVINSFSERIVALVKRCQSRNIL